MAVTWADSGDVFGQCGAVFFGKSGGRVAEINIIAFGFEKWRHVIQRNPCFVQAAVLLPPCLDFAFAAAFPGNAVQCRRAADYAVTEIRAEPAAQFVQRVVVAPCGTDDEAGIGLCRLPEKAFQQVALTEMQRIMSGERVQHAVEV